MSLYIFIIPSSFLSSFLSAFLPPRPPLPASSSSPSFSSFLSFLFSSFLSYFSIYTPLLILSFSPPTPLYCPPCPPYPLSPSAAFQYFQLYPPPYHSSYYPLKFPPQSPASFIFLCSFIFLRRTTIIMRSGSCHPHRNSIGIIMTFLFHMHKCIDVTIIIMFIP